MNLSLYLLTVLIWGTTWIAIKLQMGPVAITLSIAYRFALAALVLFAVLLLGRRLQRLDARGQRLCMAQGVCLFCLNFICFYTAAASLSPTPPTSSPRPPPTSASPC